MVYEILPYAVVEKKFFKGWKNGKKLIEFPYKWSGDFQVFENEFSLYGEGWYLKGWFGGEALLKIDGFPVGEFNVYHKEFDITPFCDGKTHKVTIEVVPHGLFGQRTDTVFKEAFLIRYDIPVKRIFLFVLNILDLIENTKDEYLARFLIKKTEEFLSCIRIPRDTRSYLKTITDNPEAFKEIQKLWNPPKISSEIVRTNGDFRERLLEDFESFKDSIINFNFPKYGNVMMAGHAHIDYAWLWPVDETKRKILRTFANVVSLAEKYDDFVFIQSSAKMYKDLKEISPELYGKVKELIRKGKWEPVGGMWVESDCLVPTVESLIRQFYYGQKFFEKEFGLRCKEAWLPDVFGFSWTLPQILKEAGIDFFVTTKLNWNEYNEFPYDLCVWKGIDGSEVMYYSFNNPDDGYNGKVSPKALLDTWENFRHKDIVDTIFMTFGYGDGGGGPTEDMCESYHVLKVLPGLPKVVFSKLNEFANHLRKKLDKKELPVWDGELYLELHRGTFTSQSRIKTLHKKAEDALREAEILNAFAGGDAQSDIDELWDVLLYNEFHDILPSSSIKEVYDRAERELKELINSTNDICESFVEKCEDRLTIFNPSSFTRRVWFLLDQPFNLSLHGKELTVQKTFDGKYLYYSDFEIEPLGFIEIKVNKGKAEISEGEFKGKLKVMFDKSGRFNVYDTELDRWAFKDYGNVLAFYKNVPFYWDNWDIDPNYEKSETVLNALLFEKIEEGPLREVYMAVYEMEGSIIKQFICIYSFLNFVEVINKIDWHTRRALLRVKFPTTVLSRTGRYDIDVGFVERPTHENTTFEKARFEVPAHRWVEISQTDYGVAILNDSRYGHSIRGNTIGMSLIKSGIFPDPFVDEGYHEFRYAVMVHNDLRKVIKTADIFNMEIKVLRGKFKPEFTIKVEPENFKILALKSNEDGLILRLGEVMGTSGKFMLEAEEMKVYKTNILEDDKTLLGSDAINMEYSPFKLYTFLLKR